MKKQENGSSSVRVEVIVLLIFYLELKFTLLWDVGSKSLDDTIRNEMCHDSFRQAVKFLFSEFNSIEQP